MFKKLGVAVCALLIGLTASMATPAIAEAEEEKIVNVYFWFDYLPDSIVKKFEKETGIKVNLDTFESLNVMETKLLAGKSGYDIVIPTAVIAERLIKIGIFKKLDKSKFSNYGNLDPKILSNLAKADKDNAYGVPYCWGTTGIAFNDAMVRKRLPNADLASSPSGNRTSFREDNDNGWPWPAHWSNARKCSCWMSRWPLWTKNCGKKLSLSWLTFNISLGSPLLW